MSVRISGVIDPETLAHVLVNLRERDAREIFALRWDDDLAGLAKQMVQMCNPLWRVWLVDDEPAAIFSAVPVRPGVVIVGAFGTHLWPQAMPGVVRYIKTEFAEAMDDLGVHRCEAYVLAQNEDGRRFVQGLDGELETRLREFGRNREDFLLFRWRVQDVLRRWLLQRDEIPVLHEQPGPDGAGRAGPAASGDRCRIWH
jgi:hypothetical protein